MTKREEWVRGGEVKRGAVGESVPPRKEQTAASALAGVEGGGEVERRSSVLGRLDLLRGHLDSVQEETRRREEEGARMREEDARKQAELARSEKERSEQAKKREFIMRIGSLMSSFEKKVQEGKVFSAETGVGKIFPAGLGGVDTVVWVKRMDGSEVREEVWPRLASKKEVISDGLIKERGYVAIEDIREFQEGLQEAGADEDEWYGSDKVRKMVDRLYRLYHGL